MNEPTEAVPDWEDPIVAEVRRARQELFAAAGHDLARLCQKLREEERASGRPVVRRPPKPPQDLPGAA